MSYVNLCPKVHHDWDLCELKYRKHWILLIYLITSQTRRNGDFGKPQVNCGDPEITLCPGIYISWPGADRIRLWKDFREIARGRLQMAR